jgi:hypothetical protein
MGQKTVDFYERLEASMRQLMRFQSNYLIRSKLCMGLFPNKQGVCHSAGMSETAQTTLWFLRGRRIEVHQCSAKDYLDILTPL